MKLENLTDGSTYHLRILAEDEEGNIFTSDDYQFQTLPMPKLSGSLVRQVRDMPTATILVSWSSNTGVNSIVSYYPVGMPELVKDQVLVPLTKKHEVLVANLTDDTEYMIVIKGKDVSGNSAEVATLKYRTSKDLRPPEILDMKTEVEVNGVGQAAKAQIVVTWTTDEAASGQVEFGEGTGTEYASRTQEDSNLVKDHVVTVTDLKPSSVYHLRILTKDGMINMTNSYDTVVVTPKASQSAIDLVVNNLTQTFGFFSSLGSLAK